MPSPKMAASTTKIVLPSTHGRRIKLSLATVSLKTSARGVCFWVMRFLSLLHNGANAPWLKRV